MVGVFFWKDVDFSLDKSIGTCYFQAAEKYFQSFHQGALYSVEADVAVAGVTYLHVVDQDDSVFPDILIPHEGR